MIAKELYDQLKYYIENRKIDENTPVLITLSDVSMGERAFSEIESLNIGCDWEKGQLRIKPKDKIFRNIKRFEDSTGIVKCIVNGITYNGCGKCKGKVAKMDSFCRYCGQRLV